MSPTPLHHLGPLHPVETVLVLALALGPLAVAAVVAWRAGRRAGRER